MGDRGGTRFNILGPLEVTLGERSVAVPTGRLRSVLALLVLAAGQSVSVHEVAERLWPERAPVRVRGTVHTYVARLRRLLGDDLIQTSYGGSYRMTVADEGVDLCRFRYLVRDSRTAPSAKAELAMLEEALGLWRGRAFADMDDAWLDQEVVPGLTDEWLSAVERHIDLRLRAGQAGEVIAELRQLTADYPTRELLWLRLIEALHRTGRRVEALDAYQQLRTVLAEEFGIDPSDTLQRMQRAILRSGSSERPMCGAHGALSGRDGGSPSYDELVATVGGLTRRLNELPGRLGLLDADNARLVAENEALRAQNAALRRAVDW
jgi:DNA-binding SARP family transcriptional activator